MKKHSSSLTARATLSALFLAISIVLVITAVNINVVHNGTSGTLMAQAGGPTPIPMAPADPGPKIGYENFAAPGVLVPVKTTEAGQQPNSVEYMGRNAGEPSVGSNWVTGVDNFQSGLQTLFVTFTDSCPGTGQSATWVNRAPPTAVAIDSDPIGFTDRGFAGPTGPASRVFACQLTLLSPNTVKISFTDDDGLTWVPTQSGGLASGVDHQTIGGGISHSGSAPAARDRLSQCHLLLLARHRDGLLLSQRQWRFELRAFRAALHSARLRRPARPRESFSGGRDRLRAESRLRLARVPGGGGVERQRKYLDGQPGAGLQPRRVGSRQRSGRSRR